MIPTIVLSGHVMALGVIRSLGIKKVPIINIYYETNAFSFASKYVREKIRSPHPERYEQEFIDLIIDCAGRHGRCLLIPADDATLSVVSRNKQELEQHHIVACTDWPITEKYIDKKYTYELAHAIGVPAPKTCVPGYVEDLERIIESFMFPCLVKPCQSHQYFEIFRTKMVKVENFNQMLFEYNKARAAGLEVMVQEFIPGDDTQGVNYNSYRSHSQIVDFTARKVRLAPANFGVPRVVVSTRIPEIIEPGRKILEALNFYGYSCTEFKYDERDSTYKLMEVNGRFNRSVIQPLKCGINFPWIMYQDLVYKNDIHAYQNREQVYWIDFASDLTYSIRNLKAERYSFLSYVRPYFKKKIFAILDWRDFNPFQKRVIEIFKHPLEAKFSRIIQLPRILGQKAALSELKGKKLFQKRVASHADKK